VEEVMKVEELDGAASALSAGLGAWLPIETAPKDGKVFLGYADNGDETGMAVVYWRDFIGGFCDAVSGQELHYFVFWMPLPEAPNVLG